MIPSIAVHLIEVLAFALICHGVGRPFLSRLPSSSAGFAAATATALGYGILAELFFILARLERFNRTSVAILLGIAALVAAPSLRHLPELVRAAPRPLLILIAAGSTPSFILALYPPAGFDATMYHLVYAKLFAVSGKLVFAEALRFPVFPQLGEMPFAAALLWSDEAAAQLTQWLAFVVTACAIPALIGEQGSHQAGALSSVALWLGTPYVVYLAGNAYIDCTLTMFVTLAFASWMRWLRSGHRGWLAVAGALTGMAASTKYHGLVFVAAFVIMLIARRHWRELAVFVPVAAILALPVYGHIISTTGNPVFPFGTFIFGENEYPTRVDATIRALVSQSAHPNAQPTWHPALAVVKRSIIDPIGLGMPPHSPWVILLLPFTLAAAIAVPQFRFSIVTAAIYTGLCVWYEPRFGTVIVPLAAAAEGIVIERSLGIRWMRSLATIFVLPGLLWGAVLVGKYGPLPVTPTERDRFLDERIPQHQALRAVERMAGSTTTYVLHAPNAAYYCPGRCLGELTGPYRYAYVEPLLVDPPRLAARLREFGVSYLLIDSNTTRFTPVPPFRRVYADARTTVYALDVESIDR